MPANTATCVLCGSDVDWVTAKRAASILGVSDRRVLQFIRAGRLPGSVKYITPGYGISVWKIPLVAVAALLESRKNS